MERGSEIMYYFATTVIISTKVLDFSEIVNGLLSKPFLVFPSDSENRPQVVLSRG